MLSELKLVGRLETHIFEMLEGLDKMESELKEIIPPPPEELRETAE